MITINLEDKHIKENLEAIKGLRATGRYTDEELQKMYDEQVEKDIKAEKEIEERSLKHE